MAKLPSKKFLRGVYQCFAKKGTSQTQSLRDWATMISLPAFFVMTDCWEGKAKPIRHKQLEPFRAATIPDDYDRAQQYPAAAAVFFGVK